MNLSASELAYILLTAVVVIFATRFRLPWDRKKRKRKPPTQ